MAAIQALVLHNAYHMYSRGPLRDEYMDDVTVTIDDDKVRFVCNVGCIVLERSDLENINRLMQQYDAGQEQEHADDTE